MPSFGQNATRQHESKKHDNNQVGQVGGDGCYHRVGQFFSQANRGMVTVSFWPFAADMTAPMALVILASVIIGAAAGIILCGVSLIKWRLRAKKYQKRVLVLERQKQEDSRRD